MTKKKLDRNRKALSTLYYYLEGHVSPVSVARRAIMDNVDKGTQLIALCRLMARSLPNSVITMFCEVTGADYETVLWLGTGTHEDESLGRLKSALSKAQIQTVVEQRYVTKAKDLAAQYGVATTTIHAIWAKYGGSSKHDTRARPPGT